MGTTAKIKVLHQTSLTLMPTRTFPGAYDIELLWWHSVTNGPEETHGVRAYGCTKKWEDFLLCIGKNCLNQSVTPKTFGSYAYRNISWYIQNRTIMAAFRNKLFGRPPKGSKRMDISTIGKIFLFCSSATAKIEVLHQKLLTRMGTQIC